MRVLSISDETIIFGDFLKGKRRLAKIHLADGIEKGFRGSDEIGKAKNHNDVLESEKL